MSQNMSEVHLSDGRVVCLSYGVPLAAFIPANMPCEYHGYVKTARKWSTTTSRHASAFCGPRVTVVSDTDFVCLISPIEAKGR